MGKASRWMINFLLGKREEKEKKKNISFSEEIGTSQAAILPTTPTIKRRWSFGRSTSKEKAHKGSKSLDSINATPLVTLENQKNSTMAVTVSSTTAAIKTDLAVKHSTDRISQVIENAAAIKIQALFRSHLAKKALCSLRSLVKLQALVRGHLVRKQTTATLRGMHALMAIQVRARFQRIHMAEESQIVSKTQSLRHKNLHQDNNVERAYREAVDINRYETREVLRSKSCYLNHSQIERIEHGVKTYYSGDLSFTRQESQYEEFSFAPIENNPDQDCLSMSKAIPPRASFSFQRPLSDHDYQFQPNYMANTESSRAKVGSQSEPKQRPKRGIKPENKQLGSTDAQAQRSSYSSSSSSQSKRVAHENNDPWFIKLYRSTRSAKDSEVDCSSTIRTNSNYGKSLAAYEPHITFYKQLLTKTEQFPDERTEFLKQEQVTKAIILYKREEIRVTNCFFIHKPNAIATEA